jgi:hypothetical protein
MEDTNLSQNETYKEYFECATLAQLNQIKHIWLYLSDQEKYIVSAEDFLNCCQDESSLVFDELSLVSIISLCENQKGMIVLDSLEKLMNQLEQDLIIEQMDLDLQGKATLQAGEAFNKSSWKFDKGLNLQAGAQQNDNTQDRGAGFEEAVDDIDSMREDFRNFNLHCNEINENLNKLAHSKKSKSITEALETFRAFVSDFRNLDMRLAANSKEFKGHLRSTEMYKTKVNNLELEIRKQVDMAAQIQEDNLFFIEQINRLESAEQDQNEIFRDYDDKERKIQKELDEIRESEKILTREWEVKLADEQRKVLNFEREIDNKRTEIVYLEQKSKNLQIVHEIQKTDNTANEKSLQKFEDLDATFNALKMDFENVSSERDRFLQEMKMLEDKHTLLWDDFHKETSMTNGLKRENGALNARV